MTMRIEKRIYKIFCRGARYRLPLLVLTGIERRPNLKPFVGSNIDGAVSEPAFTGAYGAETTNKKMSININSRFMSALFLNPILTASGQ